MAIIKNKDIKKLSKKDMDEKVKDLRMELIKNEIASKKGTGSKVKTREIKRTIARILTFDRLNNGKVDLKKQVTPKVTEKKSVKTKPIKKK